MRIETLGMIRYGHFTEYTLSLPAPQAGAPDLHVIYGPNEAGKSTLLAGWMDVLFGIPNQTPYSFLHDNRALRLEAELRNADGTLSVARIKGRNNTLLDSTTDQPLPESVLVAALGGLDRSGYTTMFSLDDDTLEAGGESILASEGELGQLLFSASAGIAGLSDTLRTLSAENDAWFKPSGRKHLLADQKARLAELLEARREADLQVSTWRQMQEALAQAEAAYEAAKARRSELQTHHDRIARDLAALPRINRLRKLEARACNLPTPQEVPEDWIDALPRWQREEAALAALRPEGVAAHAETETTLHRLPQDDAALAMLPELDVLELQFGAIVKEQADLPKRQDEKAALDRELAGVMARLSRPELTPASARLPTALGARLAELVEAGPLREARLADARAELERAEARLHEFPDGPVIAAQALARLRPLVAELRRADLLRGLAEGEAALKTAQAELAQKMALLSPWQGSPDALASLDLPGQAQLDALAGSLRNQADALRDTQAEVARRERSLTQLRTETRRESGLRPQDAAQARAARDAAWEAHKAALSTTSAEMFETAMRADDRVQEALQLQARLAERLAQIGREEAALEQAYAQREEASAAQAALAREVAALWQQISAEAGARPLADFVEWLDRRGHALEAAKALAAAEAAQSARAARLADARAALIEALGPDFSDAGFATLMAEAESILENAERMALQARLRTDIEARRKALAEAEAAHAGWQAALRAACAECWIGTPPDSLTDLRAILAELARIEALLPQAETLMHRIARIDEDTAEFQARLEALATALNIPVEPDPRRLWPLLRSRLRKAQATEEERARLQAARDKARRHLEALDVRAKRLEQEIAPMSDHFGALPLSAIAQKIREITDANALCTEIATLRSELANHLGVADLAPELARLESLDADLARAEVESLAVSLQAQDQALQQAYAALATAEGRIAASGQDNAAARIESERQTLLEEIRTEARRYLSRQAGILAVEQGLRHYRDLHRSSMMTRAAEAFAHLTGGRYSGLSTRPEGRREILIAQMAEGASKPVDTLSKGTRFQLYLALRVAAYLELAARQPMVPFIADDIMETFDDMRAIAAFGLLAQMARQGQVIYLTHHAHLCEIARNACPGAQFHDLGAMADPGS